MRLDGVPMEVSFAQGFGPEAGPAQVRGALDVTPERLADLGISLPPGSLTGQGRATFELSPRAGEPTRRPSALERPAPLALDALAGRDVTMQRHRRALGRLLDTQLPIMIGGETGTGKDALAKAIHRGSRRARHPFVAVNCASVPESILDSELFGYAPGTFTGGLKGGKIGKMEAAHRGTLFLDELGELPLPMQAKLLRVVEDEEVWPVGATRSRKVSVRLVAATNRELVGDGFRSDLLARLSDWVLRLPPLRDRTGDAVVLLDHFLREAGRPMELDAQAREAVALYDWPGNVRELQHVIERAVILSRGGPLRIDVKEPNNGPPWSTSPSEADVLTDAQVRRFERENLQRAIEASGGKIHGPDGAAELLGVKPTTLTSRLRAMGIKRT